MAIIQYIKEADNNNNNTNNMNITKALVLSQICATVSAATTSLRSLNEDTRVIGGTTAEDGRYNYAVSLQDSYGHYCGGSLIAPNVSICSFIYTYTHIYINI